MLAETTTLGERITPFAEFHVNDVVEIVGLTKKLDSNHHVGRIVGYYTGNKSIQDTVNEGNGGDNTSSDTEMSTDVIRASIVLHRCIWRDDDAGDEREFSKAKIIAAKINNIRKIENKSNIMRFRTVSPGTITMYLARTPKCLPTAIALYIAEFLMVQPVKEVQVCGCSSSSGQFPLNAVLDRSTQNWWISKGHRTPIVPRTELNEYLEFSFGDQVRRISYVGICIPPLPQGPLSVREFHLMQLSELVDPKTPSANQDCNWTLCSPKPLITFDSPDLQEFCLYPPVDTKRLRLVCTKNAAAAQGNESFTSIGMYTVMFK